MLIIMVRSILFYMVTEHYQPNTQCRIGLQHCQSYTLVSVASTTGLENKGTREKEDRQY